MSKPLQQIRWTMEQAAAEFGLNPRTLSARIKQLSIVPGTDSKFSTKEMARAVFGDLEMERIRKTSAEADQIEMENKEARGDLVNVEEFCKDYDRVLLGMKRIIKSSKLPEADQDDILVELASFHEPNTP